jgi:hypothetical protein
MHQLHQGVHDATQAPRPLKSHSAQNTPYRHGDDLPALHRMLKSFAEHRRELLDQFY